MWLEFAFELATELAKYTNKKLETKYKDKAMDLRKKIWEEENKPLDQKDMAVIDNLKKEEYDLVELFRNEIFGRPQ